MTAVVVVVGAYYFAPPPGPVPQHEGGVHAAGDEVAVARYVRLAPGEAGYHVVVAVYRLLKLAWDIVCFINHLSLQ